MKLLERLPCDIRRHICELLVRDANFFVLQCLKKLRTLCTNENEITYEVMMQCTHLMCDLSEYTKGADIVLTFKTRRVLRAVVNTLNETYKRFYASSFIHWQLIQTIDDVCRRSCHPQKFAQTWKTNAAARIAKKIDDDLARTKAQVPPRTTSLIFYFSHFVSSVARSSRQALTSVRSRWLHGFADPSLEL